MKKILKRLGVLLLCFAIIISSEPIGVFAQEAIEYVPTYEDVEITDSDTFVEDIEKEIVDLAEEEIKNLGVVAYSTVDTTSEFSLTYTVNDDRDTVTITGFEGTASGDLIIPETIDGYKVTAIGDKAFYGCSEFTGNLEIGNSVTTIGDSAFSQCTGFTGNLVIPDSVTIIGNTAFNNCSGFTGDLTIPNSITTIENSAFSGCRGFTGNLTIGNSVKTIKRDAFQNCSGFTGNLTIPNSVITIGKNAFINCRSFTGNLTIGKAVTTIGESAFYGCNGFTGNLIIPNSVTDMLANTFASFNSIEHIKNDSNININLPTVEKKKWKNQETGDVITTLSNGSAIRIGLCTITFVMQNHGKEVESQEVWVGSKITEPEMPVEEGWTFGGWYKDEKCESAWDFAEDTVEEDIVLYAKWFKFKYSVNEDGNTATITGYEGIAAGELIIPETLEEYTVTAIGNNAFYRCNRLTGNLIIPDSVIIVGDAAFYECTGFTGDLKISDSVTRIGEAAFYGCAGFTGDLIIPNSVLSIGRMAFSYCTGFDGNLIIGNAVTTIERSAFAHCMYFTGQLTIPESVTSMEDSTFINGINLQNITNLSGLEILLPIVEKKKWKNQETGEEITTLSNGSATRIDVFTITFDRQNHGTEVESQEVWVGSKITEPEMPVEEGWTFGGWYKDEQCKSVWDFTKDTVEEDIVLYAKWFKFKYSVNEEENTATITGYEGTVSGDLIIPKTIDEYTVTAIGNRAFENCSDFTGKLTIPNSVTTIGDYAFYQCSGFNGDLIIPDSVETIKANAFADCVGFNGSLIIGNSVSILEEYAFYGCNGFTGDLVIPESVKTISVGAFCNCYGFNGYLRIGNSVTTIGTGAFERCNGFTGALIIPDSVETIGSSAFYGCNGFTGALIIPDSVETIGSNAFYGCSGFTGTLNIPDSVKSIGITAFKNCSGFNGSLTIGNSVTSIGNSAFSGCGGFIGNLKIGNKVKTIGSSVFLNCSGFTGDLTIPSSVTKMPENTFASFNSIKYIKNDSNININLPTVEKKKWINQVAEEITILSNGSATRIDLCTIAFNMQTHGTKVENQNAWEGSKITKPQEPEEEGWTFGGWYKDEQCTSVWDFAEDTVEGDTVLYAKWTKKNPIVKCTTVSTMPTFTYGTASIKQQIGTVGISYFGNDTVFYSFKWYDASNGGNQITSGTPSASMEDTDKIVVSTTATTEAKTYYLEITASDGSDTAVSERIAIVVNPIDYPGTKTVSVNLPAKKGGTVIITLPALPEGANYGTASNSNIDDFTVGTVLDRTVTVTSIKDWDSETETESKTFTIPVTGATNYNDYWVTVTIIPKFHKHHFTYEVPEREKNTIVAVCDAGDCGLTEKKVSLTIAAVSQDYSGSLWGITELEGLEDFNTITGKTIGTANVKYWIDAEHLLATKPDNSGATGINAAPVNAGTYYATIEVEGKTAIVSYTISKVVISSVTFTEPTAPAYGGTPDSGVAGFGNGYTGAIAWSPEATTFEYSTAYTAKVTLTADNNYKFDLSATIPANWTKDISSSETKLILTRIYTKTEEAPHICGSGMQQYGQPAICTADGFKDYYKCGSCDKLYEESTCIHEITDLDEWKTTEGAGKIAALGHDWGYNVEGAKLTAVCNNDNDATHRATLDLSARSQNYSGMEYDGLSFGEGKKEEWDAVEAGDVTVKYVGRGETIYDESSTAPTKVGTYSVKVYPSTEDTSPIHVGTADFSITVPTKGESKVVLLDDTDFKFSFFKDGSYKSNLEGDTSGTITTDISFYNASRAQISYGLNGSGLDSLDIAKFSNEYAPESISELLVSMGYAHGVGLECTYKAVSHELIIAPIEHTHSWSYSVENGSELVATCICNDDSSGYDGCDFKNKTDSDRTVSFTFTFVPTLLTYTGNSVEPTITYGTPEEKEAWIKAGLVPPGSSEEDAPAVTKTYYSTDESGNKSGEGSDTAPTLIGTYVVELKISYGEGKEATISATYSIKSDSCTVTYDLNKGTGTQPQPQMVERGSRIDPPVFAEGLPKKGSASFLGWYKDVACTEEWDFEKDALTEDITLYAGYAYNVGSNKEKAEMSVSPVADRIYNGKAHKPVVIVKHDGELLTLNKDYTVSYKNNTNANPVDSMGLLITGGIGKDFKDNLPTIIIKGKGNYQSELKMNFNILPYSLDGQDIVYTVTDYILANAKAATQVKCSLATTDNKKLTLNKDYEAVLTKGGKEYQNLKVPKEETGEYSLTITGKGNFSGSLESDITITSENSILEMNKATVKLDKIAYEGEPITAEDIKAKIKSVTIGKTTLKEDDYSVALNVESITSSGKYVMMLEGNENICGSKTVVITVNGVAISKAKVSFKTNTVFNNSKHGRNEMVVEIKNGNITKTLIEKKDYIVTNIKNDTNAGNATVEIQGIGIYSGTKSSTYKISPRELSVEEFTVAQIEGQKYQKSGAMPDVKISYNGVKLTKGTDYTLSYKYKDNKKIDTGYVTVTGKGNYKGQIKSIEFEIEASSFEASGVTVQANDVIYNAKNPKKYQSVVVVYDGNGKKLTANKDYEKTIKYYNYDGDFDGTYSSSALEARKGEELTIDSAPKAGSRIIVEVSSIAGGNYTDKIYGTYRVAESSISKAKIEFKDQMYTGNKIELTQDDVKNAIMGTDTELTYGEDFEIIDGTYVNNTKTGTAQVTVRGLGTYGGTQVIKFKIIRKNIVWWEK